MIGLHEAVVVAAVLCVGLWFGCGFAGAFLGIRRGLASGT